MAVTWPRRAAPATARESVAALPQLSVLVWGFRTTLSRRPRTSVMSADVAGAAEGERMAVRQPHGRPDRLGADVADGEPPGVAGLHLVTARAAAQRAGMEAHRERLAHQPGTRVGDDVAGVGVDADQAGDLHGDAGLLGGLPDRRIRRALARIDVAAGQFPVAGVTAAHQQQPPG